MKHTLIKTFNTYKLAVAKPLITIFVSLLIGFVVIIPTGISPLEAYSIMFRGAFGSSIGWLGTLGKATPLIFTGLAAAFASYGGCFNIGIEGQLYMGAMAAALTGYYGTGLPSIVLIPLCFIAAMLAGCAWGIVPGLLNNRLKINIFILFFITNNMAILITEYWSAGPFKGELKGIEATGKMDAASRLSRFSNYSDVNWGIVLAVAIALILWILMYKTRFGYECSAQGNNATFAEYIGINATKKSLTILAISSMIAGLAGAEQSMGVMGRFYPNFSDEYGFRGIAIGMLAYNNPIAVVIFAIFFGGLTYGGQQLEANTIISSDIVGVIQGIVMMLISADFIIRHRKKAKAKKEDA